MYTQPLTILRKRLVLFLKKPGSILFISILVLALITSLMALNFNRGDEVKFNEKKRAILLNFQETFYSYHTFLTAYGHLFTKLYDNGLLTSSNSFQSAQGIEDRKEIHAAGYFTLTGNTPQIMYLERFGNSNGVNIDNLIRRVDLASLANESTKTDDGLITSINANYIIYVEPVTGIDTPVTSGFVFLLINQQEVFKMLSNNSPSYVEYRIFNVTAKPVPIYTHTMKDKVYFPFTRTRATVDEVVTFGTFSWLFRFYFYDSSTEITQFITVMLIIVIGLVSSLILYTFSLRNYRALRKAQHLESQKDEFVAIASHELKTPLTSVKALNQILAQKLESEGNVLFESFFRKMDTQIGRMETLINDLLDVSRIRSGKLSYKMEQFDLEAVVRSVCEDISTISRSHKVTVTGKIKKPVYGDKERITQVITNIVINAAKYSPQANLILVTMKETAKEAIISFQDFGIGISREDQRRIFERFYRVSTDEHKYKGLGIGLFISTEIIRKHKGKIWVKSKRGKGSVFAFSLPFNTGKIQ